MSVDDNGTIRAIEAAREVFRAIVATHGGRVVDTTGDSVLAIFQTAAGAASAALTIQRDLEAEAERVPEDRRLRFRLGLHLGDVVQKSDGTVYGDGVNIAARLQGAARPGGIVASESVRVAVRGKLAANFEDIGEQSFKNLGEPVRVHHLTAAMPGEPGTRTRPGPTTPWANLRSPAALPKLKRTAVAALVVVLLCGLAAYFAVSRPISVVPAIHNASMAVSPLSILVLPFANQTGDEKKAYVADALTTSITADLSRIRDASVVPIATAFTYRNKVLTVQQIGREAAVRFVLQGSVLASGNSLRITAQLADTKNGTQLWNETFDGDLANLFALQDQITALIGNSIGKHMVIVAARDSDMRKSTPEVGDLMMRARALQFQPQSLSNFVERESLYRKALAQEPDNLNAMARLASTLAIHAGWFDDSNPDKERQMREARDMALRVKAIDPEVRGLDIPIEIYAEQHNDFETARRAYEAEALKDPRNPVIKNNFGTFYRGMGEPELALPLFQQALALYPNGNEDLFDNLGTTYLALGDNDAAINWLLKAVDLNSELLETYWSLAIAYSNKGDRRNAAIYVEEYKKRAAAMGFKGIEGNAPPPGSPARYVTYFNEHLLPEWKKAGLP
jgi:TolB-like protein